MKSRIIKAAITAVLSLALYPLTNLLALAERGYQAIGGEETRLWSTLKRLWTVRREAKSVKP